MSGIPRQLAVVVAALINVGVNALAGAGVLFGIDTGAVSDAIETGVTPAGWAFSIWGVIFVGVLIFALSQALPRARGPRFDQLAAPFILANLLTALWQFPWLTGNFGWSALVIIGILASLIWLYIRVDRIEPTGVEVWVLGVPTSLYLGWVSVATAINITVALVAAGWQEPPIWAPILVLVVAGAGAAFLSRSGDAVFGLVLLWAFAAIYAANVPSPGEAPMLAGALGLGVLALIGALVWGVRQGRSLQPQMR